jgi:hypothetical protein
MESIQCAKASRQVSRGRNSGFGDISSFLDILLPMLVDFLHEYSGRFPLYPSGVNDEFRCKQPYENPSSLSTVIVAPQALFQMPLFVNLRRDIEVDCRPYAQVYCNQAHYPI